MSDMLESNILLTEQQAADLLQVSTRTLQAWRCGRIGPPFSRIGRLIRYRRSELLAWIASRSVLTERQVDE
jgi:excisionase family DNA binding protein